MSTSASPTTKLVWTLRPSDIAVPEHHFHEEGHIHASIVSTTTVAESRDSLYTMNARCGVGDPENAEYIGIHVST